MSIGIDRVHIPRLHTKYLGFSFPLHDACSVPRNRFRRKLGKFRFKIHFSEVRRSCTPTSHLLYMALTLDSTFPWKGTERGETALLMSNHLFTCRSTPFHAFSATDKASCMLIGEMHVADMYDQVKMPPLPPSAERSSSFTQTIAALLAA